jgi:hypothetical protein
MFASRRLTLGDGSSDLGGHMIVECDRFLLVDI